MSQRHLLACALLGASLFMTTSEAKANGPAVLAQYVLMADSAILSRTVPLVRVILAQPASGCPSLVLGDGSPSLSMVKRRNPNPAAFGVDVCEAVVEVAAGVSVTVEGQSSALPVPAVGPMQINDVAVLGDSGCKKPKQHCKKGWPLPAIAVAAAAGKPDLVLHMGDYNYSGTPSKTGAGEWSYDGCVPADGGPLVRQSTYDTWATWNHDFFTPAAPLLAAAPWVVTRGNHELCSRAGQGWFYLLDPHSPLLDPYQSQPSCDAPTMLSQPYMLSFANLELVMYDTANACGGEDSESAGGVAYEVRQFMLQLNAINALLSKGTTPAWLVGHRPLWSVQQYGSDPPTIQNQTMQPALAATPNGALSSRIAMLVSGHMHQFFSLTFQKGSRPPQLVIGNSGVKLSDSNILPSPWSETVDSVPAAGLSVVADTSYGYLQASLTDAGHWTGTVEAFDAAGNAQTTPVATCGLPVVGRHLCVAP